MIKRIILIAAVLSGFLFFNSEAKKKDTDSYALQRGIECLGQQDSEEAKKWLKQEIAENPKNAMAFLYLNAAYYLEKDYAQALSALNEAIKLTPKKNKERYSSILYSRARIMLETQDTLAALNDFSEAIRLNPVKGVIEDRAELYFDLGEYDLSDNDFRKMLELDPGSIIAHMGIGRNAAARKQWDEAIKEYDYANRLDQSYSSAYSFRAEAYIGKKEWIKAADDIIMALEIDGDSNALHLLNTFPEEGVDILKSKLKIKQTKEPENIAWFVMLATVYQNQKEFDQAIDYYKQANALDADAFYLTRIAICYNNLKNYRKALEFVQLAEDMTPDNASIAYIKAQILKNLENKEEAITEISKYIANDPERIDGYLVRNDLFMSVGKYKEAAEDMTTLSILPPPADLLPYIHIRRADAYSLMGEKEKAEKDYREVIRLEEGQPLNADSWTPFAESGLGNHAKAIEQMKAICDNDTTDKPGSLYNLACIYNRSGDKGNAIKFLREALEAGYTNISHVKSDYDLNSLQNEPAFKELIEKYEIVIDDTDNSSTPEEVYTTEVVDVPFTKEGGVTKVKCTINELPLHFVFDTGAADVTISMVEANFMLKNGYINKNDMIGSARYMDANGDISEGTVINLKKVNFGGLELENVRASVVRNQRAPLLLGQSVLGRLGKIEIDNSNSKLKISHKVKK